MDAAGAPTRMLDDFLAAYKRLGKTLPAAPGVCGGFADLCWQPYPWEHAEMEAFERDEPAFVIRTGVHQLAFHRVYGEIRYFAGPGASVAKLFAPSEIGLLDSVDDAARFAAAFLEGVGLDQVNVPRRLPQWAIEGRRERARVWGPIDPAGWRSVPCTAGRVATPDDVDGGRAVFVLRYNQRGQTPGERSAWMATPGYASPSSCSSTQRGSGMSIGVTPPGASPDSKIVIPYLELRGGSPLRTEVAVRFIRGHWATRPLETLEMLDGPTDAFFHEHQRALARAAAKPVWSNA